MVLFINNNHNHRRGQLLHLNKPYIIIKRYSSTNRTNMTNLELYCSYMEPWANSFRLMSKKNQASLYEKICLEFKKDKDILKTPVKTIKQLKWVVYRIDFSSPTRRDSAVLLLKGKEGLFDKVEHDFDPELFYKAYKNIDYLKITKLC